MVCLAARGPREGCDVTAWRGLTLTAASSHPFHTLVLSRTSMGVANGLPAVPGGLTHF